MQIFQKSPQVREVQLQREYRFTYENFAILTQHDAYLLLESSGITTFALKFKRFSECRYGGPNDEAHDAHPLSKYGLGAYGFFEVKDSPRIKELMIGNRVHPSHSDSMFNDCRHFIACFKDRKFECICREVSEVELTRAEIDALVAEQLSDLSPV